MPPNPPPRPTCHTFGSGECFFLFFLVLSIFLAGPTGARSVSATPQERVQHVGDATGAPGHWHAGRGRHAGHTCAATATLGCAGTQCKGDARGARRVTANMTQ